ncbi:MAG TPA: 3-methyl-2-oxobutanoate dehydrogenase (2-methylpropanoyl-transferring) subunit alpha, partial [Allosphingosinicella sp.]|nr:3-methyl-2-oxobutanoate dehydrogenase (2-methylpropanoyl-transferring) subunit alpha [Allosphingosinicella sp.]
MSNAPERPNRPALALHVPEPDARPGDEVDFSNIPIPAAGSVARPDVAVAPAEIRDYAYTLIRVLDGKDRAVGPWDPRLDPDTLRRMLRDMMMVRVFDDRMY